MRVLSLQVKCGNLAIWPKKFEHFKKCNIKYSTQILSFFRVKIQNTNIKFTMKMYFKYTYFRCCPTLFVSHSLFLNIKSITDVCHNVCNPCIKYFSMNLWYNLSERTFHFTQSTFIFFNISHSVISKKKVLFRKTY